MNPENGRIIIQLSKIKIFLLFLCSLAFVACGLWIVIAQPESSRYNKYYLLIIGIAAVVLFGMCAAALFIKLFDRKPGLIIDDSGITDNSGALADGFIPWTDITGVESVKQASQKFILVYVRNPEEYINRKTSFLAKKIKSSGYKHSGTPIAISANSLKIKFEALRVIVFSEYDMFLERSGTAVFKEQQ